MGSDYGEGNRRLPLNLDRNHPPRERAQISNATT